MNFNKCNFTIMGTNLLCTHTFQYPVRLTLDMAINKLLGQTISVCDLDLSTPCFLCFGY